MSHESLDSTEISVEVDDGDDDSIGGMLPLTEDKELPFCKFVLENDSSLRKRELVWRTI